MASTIARSTKVPGAREALGVARGGTRQNCQ
jgi:hypothetical protein